MHRSILGAVSTFMMDSICTAGKRFNQKGHVMAAGINSQRNDKTNILFALSSICPEWCQEQFCFAQASAETPRIHRYMDAKKEITRAGKEIESRWKLQWSVSPVKKAQAVEKQPLQTQAAHSCSWRSGKHLASLR
jgi:hypothetical protein